MKKKRTPAQIRATKKLVAFNKARRRANPTPAKRRVKAKKKVTRVSQATGKKPSARLKRRRSMPKKKGYYPNPTHNNYYIVKGKMFFDGAKFVSTKKAAAVWHSQSAAKSIAQKLADATGATNIGVLIDAKKY